MRYGAGIRIGTMIALVVCANGVAQAQFGPAPVSVQEVVQRKVAAGQSFVGTVMPLRKSTVGSAVDGRVVEYSVNEGDYVKKGDVLAKLLTGTIEIELAGAKAELNLRREELAELKNGSRPEEIDQARAKLATTKARMEYSKGKLIRFQSLFDRQTLSKEELEEATSFAAEGAHSHEEAQAALKLVLQGPRKEKIAQQEAKVLMQEEAVRRIEDRLEKFTIRAYFDGYVTAEHTEVGHWVREGEPIVEIAALDQVEIRVQVLENYIDHVTLGSQVRAEVGALPERTFLGEISVIVPQADVRSRTFPVHVRLNNPKASSGPLLKAGMFARVTLPVGKEEDALLVSKDAIVLGQGSPVLYVVDPDPKDKKQGKARPVTVELGVAEGGLIQVRGPLKAGEKVVIRGNERVFPNQPVTIIETQTAEVKNKK